MKEPTRTINISVTQSMIDQGRPFYPDSCPVAFAFYKLFPGEEILVGNEFVTLPELDQYYLLPQVAKEWIRIFDNGEAEVSPFEFEARGPYKAEELKFYLTNRRDTRIG